MPYFQRVLDLESKVPSEEKILPGFTHNYLGIAYHYGKNPDYTRALDHYQKALEIHLNVKGRQHAGTAYVYHNLATLYRALKDYAAWPRNGPPFCDSMKFQREQIWLHYVKERVRLYIEVLLSRPANFSSCLKK